jgi:hypothetical protein
MKLVYNKGTLQIQLGLGSARGESLRFGLGGGAVSQSAEALGEGAKVQGVLDDVV